MARVFDAFDERLERPVAVKVLRAETRALPGMRQRFQQEALIAARLIHPHIVAVLDFGEDDSASYLVMERLPGSTLRDEIVLRGPLSTGRVALVMAETLTALAAAHGRGVLHRDIKPSNILLQQDGHTKISDFGIAKSFDVRTNVRDDMTMTGIILGTPGYLAPERRSGRPATVQSDVYAVGAVMVEALSGQRLGAELTPADSLAPPWRDVALRALAPDPRQRFRSANDMLQALRISTTGPSPAPRPPMTTTVRVPRPNGTPPPPSTAASLRPVPPRPSTPSGARRRRVRAGLRRRPGSRRRPLRVAGRPRPADGSGRHHCEASRHRPADAGADAADDDTIDRGPGERSDHLACHVPRQRRISRRRGLGQRSPGDGGSAPRGGTRVRGPADALARRRAPGRGRHHVRAV